MIFVVGDEICEFDIYEEDNFDLFNVLDEDDGDNI